VIQSETRNHFDADELSYEQLLEQCAAQKVLIAKLQNEKNRAVGKFPPLSNETYEYFTNLQYEVRSLAAQVKSFKSGKEYIDMRDAYRVLLAEKDKEIKRLKLELGDAHCQVVKVRMLWQQTFDDVEVEHSKALLKKDRKIKALEKELLNIQIALDSGKDKYRDALKELYQVKTELEDEQGKNSKLRAQINRDYENSSKPSSASPNRKKIENSRDKSGKKPGGQPGHKGHGRKKQTPTNTIHIPAPAEYANSPNYKPTGQIITKQVVGIRVVLTVDEYATPEFRDLRTGQRVHADFPEGVVNDVNYDGSIKSFAFLLNNHCNVSIVKTAEFLSELTNGELNISTGMINGLSKEFSLKSEAEQKKTFADLLLSPVMNVDLTSARVNGKNMNVIVCANPSDPSMAFYAAKEHKGHASVKDTPLEDFQGTAVHDHDITFYTYARLHQECLQHVERYLKDSMANEPKLTWNKRMLRLIKEMIHFRKRLDPNDKRDPDEINPEKVAEFESRYDEILKLAKEEYEYEPPTKYYVAGFNLYEKLFKYRDNHLLFLHDRRIPPTNNLSERLLRVIKRKAAQVMAFRSFENLAYLCQSLSTVTSLRNRGENLYDGIASVFRRVINRDEDISA